jgi:hypothetical protein
VAEEDPRAELGYTFAFNSRDWAQDKADAWLYGIVVGWGAGEDPEDVSALPDLALRHRWSPQDVARLERLHANFQRLTLPEVPARAPRFWRPRSANRK